VAFFECFNQREFFQAHEVLEPLWLAERGQANDHFYKGLIQLAGAFVHLQKSRLEPAVRLLQRARIHLEAYPPHHAGLDLALVRDQIDQWLCWVKGGDRPPERSVRLRLREEDFGTGTALSGDRARAAGNRLKDV
jgi:hypothetical protein